MNTKTLREYIVSEMKYLPAFINKSDYNDIMIWNEMSVANNILSKLLVDAIISDVKMTKYIDMFDNIINNVLDVCDDEEALEIAVYFTAVLDFMLSESLNNELFEAAYNIKKFKDEYFQKLDFNNEA
jgi:hypothetical protein